MTEVSLFVIICGVAILLGVIFILPAGMIQCKSDNKKFRLVAALAFTIFRINL